jgi:hypothetical protein
MPHSKKRPVSKARSTVNVSPKRKGIESQARSASGGTRSASAAIGSRMARAKKLRPAARASANNQINREADSVIEKKMKAMAGSRATARAGNAAAKAVSKRKGTSSGTGANSLGASVAKNRNIAAAKRTRQARSAPK